jgi:hypothetical protein
VLGFVRFGVEGSEGGKGPPPPLPRCAWGFSGFEMGSAADARFEIVLGVPALRSAVPPRLGFCWGGRPEWQLFETGTVRFVPVVTGRCGTKWE